MKRKPFFTQLIRVRIWSLLPWLKYICLLVKNFGEKFHEVKLPKLPQTLCICYQQRRHFSINSQVRSKFCSYEKTQRIWIFRSLYVTCSSATIWKNYLKTMSTLLLLVPSCSLENLICDNIDKNTFQITAEDKPPEHCDCGLTSFAIPWHVKYIGYSMSWCIPNDWYKVALCGFSFILIVVVCVVSSWYGKKYSYWMGHWTCS